MSFTRTVENFTCAHCGTFNRGDGYTNHCRNCLYSRHVDVDPGDRSCDCRGLMRPVAVQPHKDHYLITHQCLTCGAKRQCRSGPADSFDAILAVSKAAAERALGGR